MINYKIFSLLTIWAIMEKNEFNECKGEHFNSPELIDINQIKLAMEKVKQSIYQKSQDNPEIGFLLKRL
jgi:hypothetical protein